MKFDFFLNHMTMMLVPLIVFSFVAVAYITGYYFHDRKFGSRFDCHEEFIQKSCFVFCHVARNCILSTSFLVALLSILVVRMKLTGDSIYEKTTRSSAFRASGQIGLDLQSYRYFCTL